MDGGKFCVFDRSVLVSNGVIHSKVSYVAYITLVLFIWISLSFFKLEYMYAVLFSHGMKGWF